MFRRGNFLLYLLTVAGILNPGFPSVSHALDIYGVYFGSCKREIGTIINVRDQSFDFLTVKGKIKSLPRYQAIYLAAYPIDLLPISNLSIKGKVDVYSIESRFGNKIKPLLKGWAVNFTEDQVSFLTVNRDEVLVDKVDIWNIKKEKQPVDFRSSVRKFREISFMDPYPFSSCKREQKKNIIAPQRLYSNAVDVKREFDRLQSGHQELAKFIRRKKFYPRPEVYENKSTLGLWLMSGARYGASKSRSNNFSPFLRNEVSLGAYSYQHLITTGSGPISDGTHLETQMHFYYRMKAEYVHLSVMADPSILLVGSQYKWKSEDMDSPDFRGNETIFIEFGFDYGRLSLELSPVMGFQTGIKFGNTFLESKMNIVRYGLRYTGLNYTMNLIGGVGRNDNQNHYDPKQFYNIDFKMIRMNLQKKIHSKHEMTLSLLNKSSEGHVHLNPYKFNSWSLAGIYKHEYRRRFYFSGLLGLESFGMEAREGTVSHKKNPFQVNFGVNASLKF